MTQVLVIKPIFQLIDVGFRVFVTSLRMPRLLPDFVFNLSIWLIFSCGASITLGIKTKSLKTRVYHSFKKYS